MVEISIYYEHTITWKKNYLSHTQHTRMSRSWIRVMSSRTEIILITESRGQCSSSQIDALSVTVPSWAWALTQAWKWKRIHVRSSALLSPWHILIENDGIFICKSPLLSWLIVHPRHSRHTHTHKHKRM